MIASFIKAIAQLGDRRFRRVLVLGLITTLTLYVLLYLAVGWGLAQLHLFGIGWADTLTDILGGVAIFVVTLILFPGIATVAISLFLDDIASAVEATHYPALPPARHQSWWEITWGTLRFALVSLALNLLALPVYVILLITGISFGLYFALNAYLLARGYFELAAWRRLPPADVDTLRKRHIFRLWTAGLVISVASTLPVINLVAPLIATAAMVHEVENLRTRGRT